MRFIKHPRAHRTNEINGQHQYNIDFGLGFRPLSSTGTREYYQGHYCAKTADYVSYTTDETSETLSYR